MDSEEFSSAEPVQTPDDTGPQPAGPGATLRAAREAQRIDIGHIAAETRIPMRHLEAIEAGNFESLPSRTYAIGFSRTYAKAVGLDEAAITEAVRAELADGSMRRSVPSAGMAPGDPARVPSAGLAWVAAGAVVVLAVGVIAFYNSYFGAGTRPGSLLAPAPAATEAAARPSATPAAASSGPVVFTALEDGIWLRLYEEGGARLVERTLKQGETVEVPQSAVDPRINTGRPDALGVTIGGQTVAKLSERAENLSGVAVSAAALTARAAGADTAGTQAAPARGAATAPRPVRRRAAPAPSAATADTSATGESPPVSEPAATGDTEPAPGR